MREARCGCGRSSVTPKLLDVRTLWIGLAGFGGAIARYAIDGFIATRTRSPFPFGTLVVNATGCFLLGFVFTLLTERLLPHASLRISLTVGFLGAYTTFSTFSFETVRLIEDGALLLAASNILVSLVAGIVAVYAGISLGRVL